jgi:protein transport protein SEC24
LGFYKNFGITMARNQICLDLFIFPTTFMESGTLASLTGTTGGHIYLYNNFNEARDSERLYLEMHRNLSRETGSDAVLKVRSSTGISIRRCLGNFHTQVEGDMDLAGVDSDTAFAIEFKHDLKLDEKVPNYIQAAMLYTARDGTRRIRLHTLRVGTIGDISKLFKKADLDATLNIYSRLMIDQVVKNRDALNVVRQMITDKLVAILASYRKNCSPTSNAGQLILPDSLKMLPVYFLGLIKSPALRQGTDVLLDERITMMSQIQEMGCKNILLYCYPQLFNLTNMDEELIDEDGKPFPLPTLNSLSASRLDSSSIYLLNDDINIYIWIGREAPNEALQGLFSIDSIPKFTLETQPQPDVNTAIGDRYARIFDVIRKHRTRHGPIKVIRDRDPNEHMFLARLIEDRSTTAPSYVDYLCNLHKEIQNKLM